MLVNIKNVQVLEKGVATQLSKVQLWVCRLFKIMPQILYYYKVGVEVQAGKLRINDVVMGIDRNRWVVMAEDNKKYFLVCGEPLLSDPVFGYQVRVMGRVSGDVKKELVKV